MNTASSVVTNKDFALPERTHLRVGFVPLTDCAPLVAAHMLQIYARHGLTVELCKQASWAAVRDKLLSGELDAAQTLYGLVYGVQMGIGGPQADMAILMTLNRNGQAITGSNRLADALHNGTPLKQALTTLGHKPVFAQTFPTGTHAMWLNYWLASQGVDPVHDIESVVLPPSLMADALAHDEIDGFCAGEPWHAVAESKKAGRTIVCSSAIWPDHPEKALACRRDFAALYPNTATALIRAILEASIWLEQSANRNQCAQWLAQPEYIGVAQQLIAPRLLGDYGKLASALPVKFHDAAGMNAPLAQEGAWFLQQFQRWSLLSDGVDLHTVAADVSQNALYSAAAESLGLIGLPLEPTACPD
jgi:nitrate/nitrite transport system substrate-binding protein